MKAYDMPPLPHPAETQPMDAGTAAFRMAKGHKMPPVIGKRADFLAAARARRQPMPGFLLQARARDDDGPARIGFTCSKKVGNAVARNRAKRRLREIARLGMPETAQAGWDYVLIGRPVATATLDFEQLRQDFARAMRKVHK
jgi:ribonuclease P protein component